MAALRHGHTQNGQTSREYDAWRAMFDRCYLPSAQSFKYYGAKGIGVCERWHLFDHFLADMGLCPRGYSIERNDSTGHYEPSNCRWATAEEQANNTSRNVYVTVHGERLSVSQAARRFGINHWTFVRYVNAGLTGDQVVSGETPEAKINPRSQLTHDGVTKTVFEWSVIFGVHPQTLKMRLRRGWPIGEALKATPHKGQKPTERCNPRHCACAPNPCAQTN